MKASSVPTFTLCFGQDIKGDASGVFLSPHLYILDYNMLPPVRQYNKDNQIYMILGNPIVADAIDDEKLLEICAQHDSFEAFASQINGSFVLIKYDHNSNTLKICNDRFASIALYYQNNGKHFTLSTSLSAFSNQQGLNVDAFANFLFLRKILGDKTLLSGVQYLTPANVVNVHFNGAISAAKYWAPKFSEKYKDEKVITEIAERLRLAMQRYTSDQKKTGILMSGGLDSRALMIAAPAAFECYTTCLHENNESAVAKEVAEKSHADFSFIKRPQNLLNPYLEKSVSLTNGQQIYSESQFLGYDNKIPSSVEVLLIGLGLDIFFGGLYLPQNTIKIFGRPLLHNKLSTLPNDMASFYLNNVKYRMRQSNPMSLVKDKFKNYIWEGLVSQVNNSLDEAGSYGASSYDAWEYLHLQNFSRHYSFPMMSSIRTFRECRAPALDNDLFDLTFAMTAQQKLNGSLYQEALTRLSPNLMSIRNANTNFPANWSLRRQSYKKLFDYAGSKLFGKNYARSPSQSERSWPSPDQHLAACSSIIEEAHNLKKSEYLDALNFISLDKVEKIVDAHFNGHGNHAVMLNVLLTMHIFIKQHAASNSL